MKLMVHPESLMFVKQESWGGGCDGNLFRIFRIFKSASFFKGHPETTEMPQMQRLASATNAKRNI
jgi:hypothetical protein